MTTKQDAIKLALNRMINKSNHWTKEDFQFEAGKLLSAISEAAQPVHKTCREVPKGNGYCINCANGDYENCRYCPPKAQPVQDGDALRKLLNRADSLFEVLEANGALFYTDTDLAKEIMAALTKSAQPSDKTKEQS
jgi:hypothetical protein